MDVPEKLTLEFLLVDAVNNVGQLAEDADKVFERVGEKAASMEKAPLVNAVQQAVINKTPCIARAMSSITARIKKSVFVQAIISWSLKMMHFF